MSEPTTPTKSVTRAVAGISLAEQLEDGENSPNRQVQQPAELDLQPMHPGGSHGIKKKQLGPSHRQLKFDNLRTDDAPSLTNTIMGSPTDKMLSPCSKQLADKKFLKIKSGLRPKLLAEAFKNSRKE